MLSRVADNLYWMSRYLERAEHAARLIDVNLNQMLDQNVEYAEQQRWQQLRASLSMPLPPTLTPKDDAYAMTQLLTFDSSNPSSIMSCIAAARENARQVREQISSEMWEHVNRLFLTIKRTTIEEIWHTEPHTFLVGMKEGIQLIQGLTDATMSHSEGWHFIHLGCFIERATATALLLDTYMHDLLKEPLSPTATGSETLGHLKFLGCVSLLRSCAAFEAYCKVYTANIAPKQIVEYLLLNAESPRSLRFAANMIHIALQAIGKVSGARHAGRVERLAGRFRSMLEYDQIDDIINDLHLYLENIQLQCTQIHNAVYQSYVAYPIDVALSA